MANKKNKTIVQDGHDEVRRRLLESAGEAFAAVGYNQTRVRDIATKAGANISAINYYFHDKRGLYQAVFEYFIDLALQKYPPLLGLGDDAPPAKKLQAFIKSLLHRVLDPGRPAWAFRLMAREMGEPTAALDVVVERLTRPLMLQLRGIVRDLLGTEGDENTVRLTTSSIIGQCVFYNFARPMISRLNPRQKFGAAAIDGVADHVFAFSMAAIDGLRAAQSKGGKSRRPSNSRLASVVEAINKPPLAPAAPGAGSATQANEQGGQS